MYAVKEEHVPIYVYLNGFGKVQVTFFTMYATSNVHICSLYRVKLIKKYMDCLKYSLSIYMEIVYVKVS